MESSQKLIPIHPQFSVLEMPGEDPRVMIKGDAGTQSAVAGWPQVAEIPKQAILRGEYRRMLVQRLVQPARTGPR